MSLPTPEFKVLLFGPRLPAAGLRARAHFENGVLVVHGRDHWYTACPPALDMRTGGFDGRQWIVTWDSPLGRFEAILQGDSAMNMFVDQAPEELAKRLHGVRRKHRQAGQRFRLALWIAVLILFLPVFALAWFWLNADRFSQWAAEQISLEQEIRLGELAFAQMRPRLRLLSEDAPADEVVERIGVRLSAGSAYPFQFHVAEDARVNAFALPGGHVVVFTGLLKAADSADEVAGVLAHEISHVEARHSLRALLHGLGLRAVMAVALGDYAGGVWGDMAGELGRLSYSRDLEREADLDGLKHLRRAGLAAEGMARFFEKMATPDGHGGVEWLSSHPASGERLAALRAAIRAQGDYPRQALYSDWEQIRRTLNP